MDDDARQQALLTALTTEHFVLQTQRSTTVNEANGRSSLYLTSVSSALVALGFVAQVGSSFSALAAAVLPALFILGEFTFVRLVETSIENVRLFRSVERIRRYYRDLSPEAAAFFGAEDDADSTWLVRAGRGQVLFTSGSMVAAINSIIGGAGITLLLSGVAGGTAATVAGVAAALAGFVAHLTFQARQFTQMFPPGSGTQGAQGSARLGA